MPAFVVLLSFLLWALPVHAQPLWQDGSITLLHGERYEVGDARRQVLTFEHASGHRWGDVFVFVDRMEAANSHSFYSEFSPRIKLISALQPNENALLQGTFLAYTLEAGESAGASFNHHLMGASVDLSMPFFKYFKLSLFRRFNEGLDDGWQLTQVFALPFDLGRAAMLHDGFIDWTSATDDKHSSLNFTSQLKWDVGHAFGKVKGKYYIGTEYIYWRNKFGIRHGDSFDSHESNFNVLVKVHI